MRVQIRFSEGGLAQALTDLAPDKVILQSAKRNFVVAELTPERIEELQAKGYQVIPDQKFDADAGFEL